MLDVPENAFWRIVDSMVWNGILGNNRTQPSGRLRKQMIGDAKKRNPADYDTEYQKMVQEMLHPPGDPWASLFLEDIHDLRANVLLEHPVERSWVILKQLC